MPWELVLLVDSAETTVCSAGSFSFSGTATVPLTSADLGRPAAVSLVDGTASVAVVVVATVYVLSSRGSIFTEEIANAVVEVERAVELPLETVSTGAAAFTWLVAASDAPLAWIDGIVVCVL